LHLLAAVQPRAIGVHLERDEPAHRELVQPDVVDPQDARRALSGDPVRRQVVEVVTPG
jgi:hypothetical protein